MSKRVVIYIFVIIYFIGALFVVWSLTHNDKPKQESKVIYETLKLGDKQTKVIVDDVTGCKYIVFNNKTLTPLYDRNGKVEGCGE